MTQPGLRFVWGFVESRLPATLTVGGVSGRLVGPIEVTNVRSENEGGTTSAAAIRFDWRLRPLLARRVDMSTLTVDDVLFVPAAQPPDAEDGSGPTPLPEIQLPVEVLVAHARIRSVRVDGGQSFSEADSIRLHGFVARDEWSADSLFVWAPEGAVQASFAVTPRGAYPHRLSATFDVVTDSMAVTGTLDVAGTADSLDVTADLSAPLGARIRGIVREPRARPLLDLVVDADSTWLPDVRAEAPPTAIAGTVSTSGRLDSLRLEGRGTVWTIELPHALVDFDVTRRDSTLTITNTVVEIANARFEADGDVVLTADAPRFDVSGDWSNLTWPMVGDATLRSRSGRATVSGTAESYRLDLTGTMAPVGAPAGSILLRGSGNPTGMSVDTVTYESAAGHFVASGRVSWGDRQTARLEFVADDVMTTELLPDTVAWSFTGSLAGRMNVARTGRLLVADVTVDTLSGALSGTMLEAPLALDSTERSPDEESTDRSPAPLEASGSGTLRLPLVADSLDWTAADVNIRWFEAEVGTGSAFVSGRLGDTLSLHATLSARDLSTVSARATGLVEGKARVEGTRQAPSVNIVAEARDVQWDSLSVETFQLEAVVDPETGGVVDVVTSATHAAVGTRSVDSVHVEVSGTMESHRFDARLVGLGATGEIGASGGIEDEVWSGDVDRLALSSPTAGAWTSPRGASAMISRDAVAVDTLCLAEAGASVCGAGMWYRDSIASGEVAVDGVNGDRLAPFLPAGWSWDGTLSAIANLVVGPEGGMAGRAEAELTRGRLVVSGRRGPSTLVTLPVTWSATVGDEGGQAELALQMEDSTGTRVIDVATSITAPTLRRVTDSIPALDVRGSFTASVLDFTPLESALPRLEALVGELGLDVDVTGTVGEPELDGDLDFRNGSFRVPDLGLDVTAVQLRATGAGRDGVTVEGSLTSGTALTVTGSVPPLPTAENPARLHLEGTRLLALDTSSGTAFVSPSIDLEISPERIGVGGVIRIPTAEVELSEVPQTAVRPSPDVVFVDDSLSNRRRVPLSVELRLELGDSVQLSGFGFSGRPTGSITARDGTARQLAGTGEIVLRDGSYEALGVELDIVNGRLVYAGGPLDDPGLDVRATRTADDGVVAGLEIAGTLQQPVVTVFSEPAMLETEALSYVVLGRPIGQASQSDGNRLANVAATLGLREGNAIATRIGQRFGLSELRVEADGPLEQASVVAGRYLSPQLYISYGVGLVDPVSTFRLRYLLSSKWTLLAESGESVGVDLMFRVERGR